MAKIVQIFFVLFLFSQPAFAWPPKFGAEFTFAPEEANATLEGYNKQRELENDYESFCRTSGQCEIKQSKARIINPATEFWFELDIDMTVIEVTTKPSTVAELKENQQWLQEILFDRLASAHKLSPINSLGGGHLTLDVKSTFGFDAFLARQFFVDFSNRPWFSSYITSFHGNKNGRPLAALEKPARKAVKQVIKDFDKDPGRIDHLLRGIKKAYKKDKNDWAADRNKSHAFTIKMLGGVYVIEFRGHVAQLNVEQFIKQASLYQDWVKSLRQVKDPIPYKVPKKDPKLSEMKVLKKYLKFLDKRGLKLSAYQNLYVGATECNMLEIGRSGGSQ